MFAQKKAYMDTVKLFRNIGQTQTWRERANGKIDSELFASLKFVWVVRFFVVVNLWSVLFICYPVTEFCEKDIAAANINNSIKNKKKERANAD